MFHCPFFTKIFISTVPVQRLLPVSILSIKIDTNGKPWRASSDLFLHIRAGKPQLYLTIEQNICLLSSKRPFMILFHSPRRSLDHTSPALSVTWTSGANFLQDQTAPAKPSHVPNAILFIHLALTHPAPRNLTGTFAQPLFSFRMISFCLKQVQLLVKCESIPMVSTSFSTFSGVYSQVIKEASIDFSFQPPCSQTSRARSIAWQNQNAYAFHMLSWNKVF